MSDRSPEHAFQKYDRESGNYTRDRKQWLEQDPDKYLAAVIAHGKKKKSH